MPREGRHRAERGDQTAQAHRDRLQWMAAGLPSRGGGPGGGDGSSYSAKSPMPVNVVTGEQEFFDKLSKALGVSDSEHGLSGGLGMGGFGKQFQALATETRAQTQLMTQLLKEAQLSNQLLGVMSTGGGGGVGGTPPIPGLAPIPGGPTTGGGSYNPYVGHQGHGVGGGHHSLHHRIGHAIYSASLANVSPGGRPTSHQLMGARVGAGIAGGGVRGGMKALPYVGALMEVGEGINQGAEWLTNQRAANAQYQSIYNQGNVGNIFSDVGSFLSGGYGGSTSGLGNRMGEEGFVLSNRFSFGGLNSDDARKLYQGVAGLGFSGTQQSQALQLGVQNYSNMGMPVDQWMQAVSASAQNLNGDLANLSQQMGTVSQAAATTGQNANVLRDSLIANYQAVGSMVTGAGQSSLAGALTMSNVGTSRAFAGMSSAGMLNNPVTLNMIASSQGMSANQLLTQANSGNVAPLTGGMQSVQTQLLGNLVSPTMRTALNQFVASHGGNATVLSSPNTLQNAGQAMMAASNIPPSMIPQFLQSIGMTPGANIEDDYAKIAQTMLGSGVGSAATGTNSVTSLSGGQLTGANQISKTPTGWTAVTTGGQAGAAQALASQKGWTSSSVGQSGVQGDKDLSSWLTSTVNSGVGADPARAAVAAYGQLQSQYKVADPAISKLIQSIGNDPNVGIEVTTSKGDQVVSLDNAVRLFPDQLAKGTATIVGGPNDGKTVGEVSGQDQGKTPYGSSTSKGPIPGGVQGGGKTTAAQAWAKQHPDAGTQTSSAGSSGSGSVTVDLSQAAQQLLVLINPTGNVNTANAGGGVPTPTSGVSH